MIKVKSILRTFSVCVAIAFICLFGYIMLQNLCAEIFIRIGWETRNTIDLFAKHDFWYVFFVSGVLPPILEEVVFRLVLCLGLKTLCKPLNWPDWVYVLVSAVAFTAWHLSWSQLVYQFIMGIFFAWIFLKTRQLWWTMLIHFINNAFIITYTYFVKPGNNVFDLNVGNVILALGLAAVTTAATVMLIKKGIPYAQR